jgi:hypothetical protein
MVATPTNKPGGKRLSNSGNGADDLIVVQHHRQSQKK